MRVQEGQIFNLMDTNGRRNDVIDALRGYLAILDDIIETQKLRWCRLPESTAEFEFYRRAVALSPDVFRKHRQYDALIKALDNMPPLKRAIAERDTRWLAEHYKSYTDRMCPGWGSEMDKSVEARARHYTNTLVKLGFTDDLRQISDVGSVLLGKIPLRRDRIEALLPLDDTNIVYLRQLLKLRVFDSDGKRYYSPFCMALYALLRKERISQEAFRAIVQGLSPYHAIADYGALLDGRENSALTRENSFHAAGGSFPAPGDPLPVPEEIGSFCEITETAFMRFFKNGKSKGAAEIYYRFYLALADFSQTESAKSLDKLLSLYEDHRDMLNKAFGYGSALFQNKRGGRPAVRDFLEQEKSDLCGAGLRDLNLALYRRFQQSKTMDGVREYADTTMRIFKATGLISFENGYAELACRDLCEQIFDKDAVRAHIMGGAAKSDRDYDCRELLRNRSAAEILGYSDARLGGILKAVRAEFDGAPLDEIPRIARRGRRRDFERMIARRYPKERVQSLLALFSDRSNDSTIQKAVCPDASVPTIYEYVVGLAWYYFSNKTIDLLHSFHLTLSADFEPLTHAGGGMGDIVIAEADKVIMLEATLMNANSQKRGEWEPVLRHAVNLKIEEEHAAMREGRDGREVTTFFIADTFDANTINIWKAVSSVPLQSSTGTGAYTDGVIIMPVSGRELARLMDRAGEYNQIIQRVRSLFSRDIQRFDRNWREAFIQQLGEAR